jgi:cyclase
MSNTLKMPIRLIARLDVKGENLIKGVHLEGLRVIGAPQEFAKRYYEQGADELIYMDIVASLYGRSNLIDIVRRTANDVFVPMTVGGGVRTVEDVGNLLRAGADKIAINSAAVRRPDLITEVARKFGSQCMVLSIEVKRHRKGKWEIYTDCGREKSGFDALEWAYRGVSLGAGEILVTSIDQEGTRKGFDTELVKAISAAVDVPVIASGGFGVASHIGDVHAAGADAIAFADALHYNRFTLQDVREMAREQNIPVREI